MILFLCSNFLLFIKLFLYILIKILLIKSLFANVICILSVSGILKVLFKYPPTRFNKLSKLRKYKLNIFKKYRLVSVFDHIYNLCVITLYCVVVTSGVFYLRFLNREKILDLKIYYAVLKKFIIESSYIEIFLTGLLYILIFLLYINILIKVIKFFKFHVICRHIYLMNAETNDWYYNNFFYNFLYKRNLFALQWSVCKLIEFCYKIIYDIIGVKKDYGMNFDELTLTEQVNIRLKTPVDPSCLLIKYRKIRTVTDFTLKYFHYVILFYAIVQDIYYNEYVLSKVFYLLPWVFFYDLYVRTSIFVDDLHLPYDEDIHLLVYTNYIEIINKNTINIGGDYRDYNHFRKIYHTYVKRNFVKDRNDVYG